MTGEKQPAGIRAEIITVGDEVLSGRTLNTNAAHIARSLEEIGVRVAWVTTVGDDRDHMSDAFLRARGRAGVVITTGGIGPTHDDLTRAVFCGVFRRRLVKDEAVLRNIKGLFEKRGRPLTARNEDQAMVPEGTQVLQNLWGTAPGIHQEENGKHWFMLPGVPREMLGLLEHEVIPRLEQHGERVPIARMELQVVGLPESILMDKIADVEGIERVASLPDAKGEVCLRITTTGDTAEHASRACEMIAAALRARLGAAVYGSTGDTLERVVGRLLAERGLTISIAESCTGGLLASRLTDVPGSSAYLISAVVAYANDAKVRFLGVPETLIAAKGAVSAETAEAMARGVREQPGTDIGVAITGIAGPGGGTPEKPVGLVYLALADMHGTEVTRELFGDDRLLTKQRATQAALDMVRVRVLRRHPLLTPAERN